jgi:hypothetical protein
MAGSAAAAGPALDQAAFSLRRDIRRFRHSRMLLVPSLARDCRV